MQRPIHPARLLRPIVVGWVVLLLAIGLKFLLSRTRLGVAMRAVVDNRSLAGLNGVKPGLVSMFSWALGSGLAAIAGIFLAEELASLDVQTLTLLIIEAFAAAIIGRLKNLPMTFVGAMIIGLAVAFQQNFLTWSGRWTVAQQSIPMVILFLALLFLPQARIEGEIVHPEGLVQIREGESELLIEPVAHVDVQLLQLVVHLGQL